MTNPSPTSKEDILKQKFQKPPDGEYNPVHEAMDEHSKQQAIAFAKFVMDNTFQDMNVLDLEGQPDKWEYDNGDGSTQSVTTEELYNLFITKQ